MGRSLAVIRAGALIAALSMFPPVISPVKAGGETGETSTRDALKDYDKRNPIAVAYLQGLRTGLEWANTANHDMHQRFVYCAPSNIGLTLEQYVRVIKDYVNKNPKLNEMPAGLAMVFAARDAFPCRE